MTYSRQPFPLSAPGTFGDPGPSFAGAIQQIRWVPGTADTGADLTISLHPRLGGRSGGTVGVANDTGHGFNVYSRVNVLGSQFTEHLRAPVGFSGGIDNTGDSGWVPYVAAGDRLRVKVINQAGATANLDGTLYVWTKE